MDVVDRLREILSPFPSIHLAVLFGSLARDQVRRWSDIDLGVVLDTDDREVRLDIEVEVGRGLSRDVDLVDLRRAGPLLRFEVARDGIPVVEREPDTWSRFKSRAMVDWWDWAPTARFLHRAAVARLRRRLSGQT